MNLLPLIGRRKRLLTQDFVKYGKELDEIVRETKFLVIGGAGSIFVVPTAIRTAKLSSSRSILRQKNLIFFGRTKQTMIMF